MSDQSLRELERRFKETGSDRDEARYLQAALRVGALERSAVELAAFLAHPAALAALGDGVEQDRLPARLFLRGADLTPLLPPEIPPELGVHAETLDDQLSILLKIAGVLGSGRVDHPRRLFGHLISLGVREVVFDLSGVLHIGSSVLGLLVRWSDDLGRVGGRLQLLNVPPKIRLVIEMLGLNVFFGLIDDTADLTSLAGPAPPLDDTARLRALCRWGPEPRVRAAQALGSGEFFAGLEAGGNWLMRAESPRLPPDAMERVRAALVPWTLGYA